MKTSSSLPLLPFVRKSSTKWFCTKKRLREQFDIYSVITPSSPLFLFLWESKEKTARAVWHPTCHSPIIAPPPFSFCEKFVNKTWFCPKKSLQEQLNIYSLMASSSLPLRLFVRYLSTKMDFVQRKDCESSLTFTPSWRHRHSLFGFLWDICQQKWILSEEKTAREELGIRSVTALFSHPSSSFCKKLVNKKWLCPQKRLPLHKESATGVDISEMSNRFFDSCCQ